MFKIFEAMEINTEILIFLKCGISIKEMIDFVYDFEKFFFNKKRLISNKEPLDFFEKYEKGRKVPEPFNEFYEKQQVVIRKILSNNSDSKIFFQLSCYFKTVKDTMLIIKNEKEDVLLNFKNMIDELKIRDVIFIKDKELLSYKSNLYVNTSTKSFQNVITDGKLFFMGQYVYDVYPFIITDANFILLLNTTKILEKLIINQFDIELPSKEECEKKRFMTNDSVELTNRTRYVKHLYALQEAKNNNKNEQNVLYNCINRCLDNQSNILDESIALFDDINNILKKRIEIVSSIKDKYGFDDFSLKCNLDYFYNCSNH